MKRTILLSLLVVSMSLSATAIYDPSNNHTSSNNSSPQELKKTAVPTSAHPPDYNIDFEQETATCGPPGNDKVSITSLKVSPTETTANVDGVFQTTHPKYNLTTNIEKMDEKHYILRIKSVETSQTAPRCFGNIEYSANFTSSEGYMLKVYHNQTKITEKQMQEAVNNGKQESDTEPEVNSEPETQETSKGFFHNILNPLKNLF